MRKLIDKLATNILRFLPSLLIIVLPLLFLPLTPDYFQINKQLFLFLIASAALLFFGLRMVTRGYIQITLSPALLPLTGFALVVLLSTLIKHPNPRFALINTTAVITSFYVIFIATTSTQKTSLLIKSIIWGIIGISVVLGIFSILRHLGIFDKLSGPEWLLAKLFHPTGSPYHYLTFSIPALVATIAYGITTKNWMTKPLILAAAIIIAAASAFSLKILLPTADNQGIAILPFSAGWSIAVDTLKTPKTAILGTGPDTFSQVFTRLRPASLNLDERLWSLRFPNSSSELFTIFTTTGIAGLIFLAFAYLKTITSLAKEKVLSDPETSFILAGTLVTIIMFAVLPSNISSQTLGLVFLIAATVKMKLENSKYTKDIQLNLSTKQVSSAYSETPGKERPGLPVLPWLFTVSSVVLLAVFWNVFSRTYAANLAIYEAARNVQDNQVKAYNKQLEASKLDPNDPYLRTNLSQTYLSITKSLLSPAEGEELTDEDKQKALEFANQALNEAKIAANLAPYDVTVWENFANISRFLAGYNIEGSADWTLATYTQAINLDPTNPALRVQLGTFYMQLEDPDQASRVLSTAIELKPNWNIPYYYQGLVYKSIKQYPRALTFMNEAKKYTEINSEDMKKIDQEIADLEKLVPEPTPTPSQEQQ